MPPWELAHLAFWGGNSFAMQGPIPCCNAEQRASIRQLPIVTLLLLAAAGAAISGSWSVDMVQNGVKRATGRAVAASEMHGASSCAQVLWRRRHCHRLATVSFNSLSKSCLMSAIQLFEYRVALLLLCVA